MAYQIKHQGDKYTIELEQVDMVELTQMVEIMCGTLEESVRDCKLRERAGHPYTSEPDSPKYQADEDLMFLYDRLGKLNHFLFQARFLDAHPEHTEA